MIEMFFEYDTFTFKGLLDRNPKTRLGASDREQLRRDPFFEKIDWEKLYNKQYTPPITEFENIE